jgi:hypothetical protein
VPTPTPTEVTPTPVVGVTPTVPPPATSTSIAEEPTPTPTEPPGFEAVFANFSFQKEKFIKENTVLLVKLFFKPLQGLRGRGAEPHIRKGLRSHTSCSGSEGSKNNAKCKMKNFEGVVFLSPFSF